MAFADKTNSGLLSAVNPDLSAFAKHGGKLLMLHGLADQLLPPQGTIAYYERVQQAMGGAARTACW